MDKIAMRVVAAAIALVLAMGFQAVADVLPSSKLIDYPVSTTNIAYDPGCKIRPPPDLCRRESPKYLLAGELLEVDYEARRLKDEMNI